ncbi:hypothetical protein AGR1B_pAt30149 [Agrobacterium fabacearum S56]|nr:hypothetical protein AGR1B_pAt30149 [Agrobacterium fabacearum S56]
MVGVALRVLLSASTEAKSAFRESVCRLIEFDDTRGLVSREYYRCLDYRRIRGSPLHSLAE